MKPKFGWVVFRIALVIAFFALGYSIIGPKLYHATEASIVHEWNRSADVAPPDSVPFIGIWIDDIGQPQPIGVVESGGQFYRYDVNPGHSTVRLADELLFIGPPEFWMPLPGGAR